MQNRGQQGSSLSKTEANYSKCPIKSVYGKENLYCYLPAGFRSHDLSLTHITETSALRCLQIAWWWAEREGQLLSSLAGSSEREATVSSSLSVLHGFGGDIES